jgi:hypothetical protein
MRAWKHTLLLVGILCTSGVFAPMLEIEQAPIAVELSAYRLSFGDERSYSLLERELPRLAEQYLPRGLRDTRADVRLVAEAARWAALAYAPSALLLLLGLLGLLARRFGRLLGALAFLAALPSIGAWLALRLGIPLALREADLPHTQISLLVGAHLLLVAGIAGVLVGLGALISPDLGPRRARPA